MTKRLLLLLALGAAVVAAVRQVGRRPSGSEEDMRPAKMWPDLVDGGMAGAALKILTR